MKIKLVIIITLFLILISGLRAQDNIDLLDAYGKYYSGKYTSAIAAFDQLIASNSDHSDFYLYRGIAKYKTGSYQQALPDLVTAANMGQPDAYLWMARACVFLNEYSESMSCLVKYLQSVSAPAIPEVKKDSVFKPFHSSEAWYELWQHDWQTASQKIIDEAEYLADKQKYEEAHSLIERNIEQSDASELLLYNSKLYAMEGNIELAVNELNRALSNDPDNLKLLRQKADYLLLLKNYREAYEMLTKVLIITPEDFHSRFSRAEAALLFGKLSDARSDITLYMKYFDHENAIFLAGKIAYASEQYLDALRYFNRLLENNKGNAQYFKARGMTYYQTHTVNQAAYDLSMSLDLIPDDAEANYYLGLTQDSLGNKKMACYYLNRAKNYGELRAIDYLQKNCSK